jgi:thiol-disulfide isomerase/thioredoxin
MKSDKRARRGDGADQQALSSGFIALGVIIGLLLGIANGAVLLAPPLHPSSHAVGGLPPEVAGDKAVNFIAKHAVSPGVEVNLVAVTEVPTGNLYRLTVNLSTSAASEIRELYVSTDGRWLFPGSIDLSRFTIGDFLVTGDAPCVENGMPIMYFFGSDGCSACRWEQPVLTEVAAQFDGYIAFHDHMGSLEGDRAIFERYSPDGTIPTTVLGCTYYRIGAGIPLGEEQEARILTALICTLTNNEPEAICNEPAIQALVAQVG